MQNFLYLQSNLYRLSKELMLSICQKHNIVIDFYEDRGSIKNFINGHPVQLYYELCQSKKGYKNLALTFIVENKTKYYILMGYFKNKQIQLSAFFHELGHCLDTNEYNNDEYSQVIEREMEAWKIGYEKAKEYGIVFDKTAKYWSKMAFETYIKSNKNKNANIQYEHLF